MTLDGSGSYDTDYDLVAYEWTQLAGPVVTLSDVTAVQPTFTAPDVGIEGATLEFSLNVADSTDKTSSDTAMVYVEWKNTTPTANAGENQNAEEGLLVTLDASGSFDPDDEPLSYEWTQISGTTVVLSDFTDMQPTFTAPDVGMNGALLTFKLKVTDSKELQSTDTCVITINWVNTPPIAHAGTDQTVEAGTMVTLNGSGSLDSDDGIALYQWNQISGTLVSLSDAAGIYPTFTSPDVETEEILTFELTVKDNGTLTATDTCDVYVTETEVKDRDADGVPDDQDIFPNDPNEWLDADHDGMGNNADPDDDNDEMPDIWEAEYGLNPFENDAANDLDSDGIANIDEYLAGTDPTKKAAYQPLLSLPADGSADVSFTPEFEVQPLSDSDKIHVKTEWQISKAADFSVGFSALVLDLISNKHLTMLHIPDSVLEKNATYYWRAKFYFDNNNISEWSVPFSFTTPVLSPDDENSNGIPDEQEITDTDLDMDANGIPDITQNDILSVNTVVGNARIAVKAGENVTAIEALKSIHPDQIADTESKPESMPSGLISFRLTVQNAGDVAHVRVYFSEPVPADAKWYKYDAANGWWDYSDHAEFSDDRESVTLEFKDGGFGDADGAENGVIVDPSGFATESSDPQDDKSGGGDNCFIAATGDGGLMKGYVGSVMLFLSLILRALVGWTKRSVSTNE